MARKYTTEFLFHLRALQYVVVQPDELEKVTDEIWTANIEPAHIYLVCRRPKISLAPDSLAFTDDEVTGSFRIWDGADTTEVPFRTRNHLGTTDVTVQADYPGTRFTILDATGDPLLTGNAATLMTTFGPTFSDHLKLEVLYAGQSFGFEGSRTAQDRLRSHETLQGILAEALARSPDLDVWLVLISFEDPYIVASIDPKAETTASDDEDNAHIEQVADTPISLQQEVNLTEAMLIRYFDPPYNTMFRDSFPNPAHLSYSECYELDFHSVGIELDTEAVNCQLWSEKQGATWLHIPTFSLHLEEDRADMFGIFP